MHKEMEGLGHQFHTIFDSGTANLPAINGTSREYDTGIMTWVLMCCAVTWLIIPGVGFLYNGLARYSKSSLSLLMLCLWSLAVVSLQWYVIGFSLCLSDTGNGLIGNFDHLFLSNVGDMPSPGNDKVPLLLVGIWFCLFAVITPTVILGGAAERYRFFPTVVFMLVWNFFVFDFVTYWTWNGNGWINKMGGLDFGGGYPIHIASGSAALAFSYMVGKRTNPTPAPPHNMTHVYLGTVLIWCGWLTANAGSGFSPNMRAVNVMITTNLAGCIGGVAWSVIDYFRYERKWSPVGFCCGAICGLISVTPASGFVTPTFSLVMGFAGAVICNMAMSLKYFLRADDTFDVFACHGVGGIVGITLTGVFAQKSVAAMDGQAIGGGWLDGNWMQVPLQALGAVAVFGWSFIVTVVILFAINIIPGLHIRASLEEEQEGLDKTELGCYMYEYLEEFKGQTDIKASLPSSVSVHTRESENGKS